MATINAVGNGLSGATGTGAFVGANSPTLETPSLGGVEDASSAAAGYVGEVISSTVILDNAVSLTTATPANVTSISLTAGDWDVYGQIGFIMAGSTIPTRITAAISLGSAGLPVPSDLNGSIQTINATFETGIPLELSAGTARINVSETTSVYLVSQMSFTVSTAAAFGSIFARRRR